VLHEALFLKQVSEQAKYCLCFGVSHPGVFITSKMITSYCQSNTPIFIVPYLRTTRAIRRTCALLAVSCATGELFVNLRLAYFGVTLLAKHCLLK
jgi:hypothetical protein